MVMIMVGGVKKIGDEGCDFLVLLTHPTQCAMLVFTLLIKLVRRSNYLHRNTLTRYDIAATKCLPKCSLSNVTHNPIFVVLRNNYISLMENEIVFLVIYCKTMQPIS